MRASDAKMGPAQRTYFRDQLREARAAAERDAEGFEKVVHVVERMAAILPEASLKRSNGMGAAMEAVCKVARESTLAEAIPRACRSFHTPFQTLYRQVKDGRNDAFHEGAIARHLTGDAIILATVLEDALMSDAKTVGDLMIRQPVCAFLWQPLSFIRQTMLVNSFSYLPVDVANAPEHCWCLITDAAVARFTRTNSANERFKKLRLSLRDALKAGLEARQVWSCGPNTPIQEALANCGDGPVLVIDEDSGALIGFATPFDLL